MSEENLLPPADIPDLSDLNLVGEWAIVNRALGNRGSNDPTSETLRINGIRLADAALEGYALGHDAIRSFHGRRPEQFGLGHVLRATSNFENCLWNLERFIKHIRALRSQKGAEAPLKALLPASMRLLQPAAESQIVNLRHAISHLEKNAQAGRLPKGTSIALLPVDVGLRVGHHTITWSDLSVWLREAHECAKALSQFRP